MRRSLAVLFALLVVPLMGASSVLAVKPTVIVYPFTTNGASVDREASSRLATIIATQMGNSKLVTIIPAPPATERKDYLTVARAHNADFYVSGFISPLGSGVSVVEQVVATRGGIVAFSSTAQLQTYADAAGQGDQLAQSISGYANRAFASIASPPPEASPTPASERAEANLGRLFGGKREPSGAAPRKSAAPKSATKAATPAPIAAPSGAVAYDLDTLVTLPVEGTAAAALRSAATFRLFSHEPGSQAETLQAACAAHPRATVLQGTLGERHGRGLFNTGSMEATFALKVSDCTGKDVWNTSASRTGPSSQQAMDAAVDAVLTAFDQAKARAQVEAGT